MTRRASCSLLVIHAYSVCVRLLGWTGNLSTSQQTLSVAIVDKHIKGTGSLIKQVRIYFVNPGRTVCLHSCGLPVVSLTRPTGAQVFALFPPGCEPSSFQHLVTAPDRPPRAQAVTGNGCPIARVDRPVPSECHWHSSMHPTRGTKNNAFSSLSFPLNPVIMCWRDFDSYLIMNHSFSCIEKRAHLMICPLSMS